MAPPRKNIKGAHVVIAAAIRKSNKSLTEVAELMFVSQSNLSLWTTGRRSISRARIREIAEHINRDADSFVADCESGAKAFKNEKNDETEKHYRVRLSGVGELLREAIASKRHAELAEKLSTTTFTIANWLSGRRRPTIGNVIDLAKAIDRNPPELVIQCLRQEMARSWFSSSTAKPEEISARNKILIRAFEKKT